MVRRLHRRGNQVALSRVRGLKLSNIVSWWWSNCRTLTSAWIETEFSITGRFDLVVALSRVRGLKL